MKKTKFYLKFYQLSHCYERKSYQFLYFLLTQQFFHWRHFLKVIGYVLLWRRFVKGTFKCWDALSRRHFGRRLFICAFCEDDLLPFFSNLSIHLLVIIYFHIYILTILYKIVYRLQSWLKGAFGDVKGENFGKFAAVCENIYGVNQ
jgi:hypothetical protein